MHSKWLLVLALAALVAMSGKARGSILPKRTMNNPTTGKPISSWGPVQLTVTEIEALAEKHGFSPVDAVKAARIAIRESGGHSDAVVDTSGMSSVALHAYWGPKYAGKLLHPECSVGLWQINTLDASWQKAHPGFDCESLKDPDVNAAMAFELYKQAGWKPWGG